MSDKQQVQTPEIKKPFGASGFTKAFRDQVIEVYNSGVYASMAECARNYNVPEKVFYQWLAASKKNTLPPEDAAEMAKMRKELSRLRQENDILKKAAAYFAKEMK
jgi:transposase